jgi:hypothetical protein
VFVLHTPSVRTSTANPKGREAGVRSPSNGYAKMSTGSVVTLKKELECSGILGLVPQRTPRLILRAFEP